MKKYIYFFKGVLCAYLILGLFSNALGQAADYYSYRTGDFNHVDTWTTDPGGTTLVGTHTFVDGNTYTILAGRTVTLTADITQESLEVTVNSGATLQMETFQFTQPLTLLAGQGLIKLTTINLPNAITNNFINTNGGTFEFNNTSNFKLPAAYNTYNSLTINLDDAAYVANMIHDITFNGDLTITKGVFEINDDTETDPLELIVYGDVSVNSGATLKVSETDVSGGVTDPLTAANGGTAPFVPYYTSYSHTVQLYGDLINNGTVRFTNQDYPVYDAFPSDGFASVFFRGESDNAITCNGTTDYYNLILDKGSDQTYVLSVNSSEYTNFRLFGANVAGGEGGGDNPILKKALWLRNGTMKLYGKVVIPSLSEGTCAGGDPNSDYYIPANGAFAVEGPDVIVLTTADSYLEINAAYGVTGPSNVAMGVNPSADCSSFSIYGSFQMGNGYFSTRESGGIIYWGNAAGQIIINGGTIDAKQLRTAGSSGGLMAYRQTGGTLSLRGRLTQDVSGVTSVADLKTVPLSGDRSTGGLQDAVGTFNIERDDNIFNMTGGTIEILDVCGNTGGDRKAFEINSLSSNISVSGGQINLIPTNATGDDMPFYFVSSAPLYNVTIDATSAVAAQTIQLTGIVGDPPNVTERLTQPLTVLNNLTLSNGATLVAYDLVNDFEVQVGGDFSMISGNTYSPGSNRTTFNGSGAQTFTGGGTITGNFHNLKIDKSGGTITLAGTPGSYTVTDSLIISQGTIDDGGKTLNVAGHIYNAGEHTGTGKILLNGTGTQTLEASVFGSPTLGNLELSNGTDPGAQLISDFTASTLTLTANTGGLSIFDIQDYRLTLTGGVVQSSGNLAFGDDKMVRTSGAISAKGLSVSIDLTGGTSPDYLFPLGVDDGGINEYSPYTLLTPGDPGTTSGTITIIPVNSYHATVKNTTEVIEFYWSVKTSGFAGANAAGFRYYFVYFGSISNNQNKAAYLDYESVDGWITNQGLVNRSTGEITFNTGLGFLSTDFTAGKQSAFNKPRILYSRASTDWHLASTWSETAFGGAIAAKAPETYDRFIIGGALGVNHTVSINTNLSTIAGVEIYSAAATGISGTPPTLNNPAGNTGINVTYVSGGGRYIQNDDDLPSGDFGDFCNNDTAIFEYSTGTYDIPAEISVYPNLHITSSSAGQTKTLPDVNILVRQNLVFNSGFSGSNLSFNSSTNARSLTIYGDAEFENTSQLIIPATTGLKTINLYGDLNFRYNNTDDVNGIVVTSGAGTTHKLNFYGSTITSGNSKLTLYSAGTNLMDLYLLGAGDLTISNTTGATTNFTLNKLIVEKDILTDNVYFQNNFTLNAVTSSSPKALQLNIGTFYLENALTSINLSSGGADFQIPQTAALILKNGATVNVTGTNTGIFLDGQLRAESSTINMGDGSNTDNRYIEYSGTGNASLELTGSSNLTVNSQIRRSLSQTNSILKYTQEGTSTVTIYGRGVNQTRAKLEIVNDSSSFDMSGGTITIVYGGGTTFGDLYLRPHFGGVTGGTINIGSTVSGQSFKLDANITLNNLNIVSPAASNTAQIMVNHLILNGNLNISSNSTLDANGKDVSLKGNLTNNGTYGYGLGNTTTFNGDIQTIDGSTITDFYNLTANSSTSLTLIRSQLVHNNLVISGNGTLVANAYDIEVKGDLTNTATHSSTTGKIILNGISGVQGIYGSGGSYGLLELDNADGARLYNNISLTKDFYLTNGILNINQYMLTLGVNSNIIGAGFGITKMITPDGVFSNVGIKKYFDAAFTGDFEYPLGITGTPNIYTPALVSITSTDAGFMRINSINDRHPATLDPRRVLDYYWEAESDVSAFYGEIKLYYDQSDVVANQSDEDLYVAGRVIVGPADSWSKASTGPTTDNVDESTNEILFQFSDAEDLSGEYTAGRDEDLPDIIPVYYSKAGVGNWDDVNHWDPVAPSGGPNGFKVVIPSGSTVNTNGNRRFAYHTTINGRFEVGETYAHNLGTVSGTGTLSLEDQTLPAGRFDDFFTCAGGSLEYGGTKSYTIVADRIDTLRNLHFIGSGTKTLPDKDLVICNEFLINGPTVDNAYNRQLTIGGTMVRSSGIFLAKKDPVINNPTVRFKGLAAQTLSGFNESTSSPLYNLEIDNPDGLTLGSQIDFDGDLKLTDGIITTTSTNILYMRNIAGGKTVSPVGGSLSSYIDGPMKRHVFGGLDFIFPVGKGSRQGKIGILGPSTDDWIGEYFNSAYGDLTVNATNLSSVSSTEHWKLIGPNDASNATVQLRWDELSDINPTSVTGGVSNIKVAEYTGALWDEQASNALAADSTVTTSGNITVKNTIHPQYYTLGSKSSVSAMARFASGDDVCVGTPIPITFSGVTDADLPFVISYEIDNVGQTDITINSLPYAGLPTASEGVYELVDFKYNYVGAGTFDQGLFGNDLVTVNLTPSAPTASDVSRCGPGIVTLTASDALAGYDYKWYTAMTGGTLLQTDGDTYNTPYLNSTSVYYVAIYNTTTGCESSRTAVQAIIANKPAFTVTGDNFQLCDGETYELTVLFSSVTATYDIVINDGYTDVVNASGETNTTQYVYNNPTSVWVGPTARRDYTYVVTVTDANGCVNDPVSPVTLYVWKIPETGPQYHIDNNWGN